MNQGFIDFAEDILDLAETYLGRSGFGGFAVVVEEEKNKNETALDYIKYRNKRLFLVRLSNCSSNTQRNQLKAKHTRKKEDNAVASNDRAAIMFVF